MFNKHKHIMILHIHNLQIYTHKYTKIYTVTTTRTHTITREHSQSHASMHPHTRAVCFHKRITEIVRFYLSQGCPVDIRTSKWETPLHYSVAGKSHLTTQFLVDHQVEGRVCICVCDIAMAGILVCGFRSKSSPIGSCDVRTRGRF